MAKMNNDVDFSLRFAAQTGRVSAAEVPRYILYGDASARPDWFVNVEPLDRRSRERGWLIGAHTHPRFMQMVVCTDGGGEMSIEGETLSFGRASVLIVPPHRIHGFRYEEASNGWVITIESHYLADLLVRAPALKAILDVPGAFQLDPAILPTIIDAIVALSDELREAREAKAIGAEIQLLSLLLGLLRHWPASERERPARTDGRADLVERYKELVENRYREQPHLPDLAGELNVSTSQLRLACRTVAGMSPLEMMHDRILVEARRCLAYTRMSVGDVAHWLGFSDAPYFSRFFTKIAGQSPTEYRRRQDFGGGDQQSPDAAVNA